jgi:CheY-like chemotaxis protein
LIITDLVMPDKTGVEFIRSLRRSGGALAQIPILVITGYDGMVVQGAKLAGATRILRKPNDLERLAEVVNELLQPPPKAGT